MLTSPLFVLLVGSLLGFLAGLGVGGGSLLMLWLTLILQFDYSTAKVLNLLFFLPTAAISSVFRWKQGALDFHKILPGIIAGCLSAAAFAFLGQRITVDLVKKGFGVLLLLTGIKELLYKPKS